MTEDEREMDAIGRARQTVYAAVREAGLGDSVKVSVEAWFHRSSASPEKEPKGEREYTIWLSEIMAHFKGRTLQAAVDGALSAIAFHSEKAEQMTDCIGDPEGEVMHG